MPGRASRPIASPRSPIGRAALRLPSGGLNTAACSVGERELRSLYFMPHEAAIKEGHLTSVMASYNTTDGIPSHANRWALTTVLRDEWGFKGYIYCDWGGIALLEQSHHIARSAAEAGMLALKAGVDLEAAGGYAYPHLVEMVRQGKISERLREPRLFADPAAEVRARAFRRKTNVPRARAIAQTRSTRPSTSLSPGAWPKNR